MIRHSSQILTTLLHASLNDWITKIKYNFRGEKRLRENQSIDIFKIDPLHGAQSNLEVVYPELSRTCFFIIHILTYTNYEKLYILLKFFLCECL